MKVGGARNDPFGGLRRRAQAPAGAQARPGVRAPDTAAFLGVPAAELTPAVQAAIQALSSEVEDLRGEVARLKAHLIEAKGLADRDALTPLLNRRALVRELGRIAAFSQRYGSPASLVYLDLDGLKAINDRLGHAAGDAALQAVAERLTANVRESDVVGRMGGDEFAVILVQADLAVAEAKARTLVQAVEREPLSLGEWSAPLHLSWGAVQLRPDWTPEEVVAQADRAMYAAKRARTPR
jgi:diguanylate cyclase (GGDEF)-like protein